MEYRQLGRSGLYVSVLALGTMTFGGKDFFGTFGDTDVAGAKRQIGMCLDAGVNLIDTANMYSAGAAEEILGKAIAGARDRVLISSKVRLPMGDGPNEEGLSRHHILSQVEGSLRRLGTDYLDIYHVHQWDGLTPLDETLETLDTLVHSGKVRYLGVSNYSGWQLMKALAVADLHGYERFVSNQIYYSLESRDAEYELVPLSLDQGLGILVWSPLAGGLLSGKYRRGQQAAEGRHLTDWNEPPVRDENKLYDTIETVIDIAATHDVSPAQISLAYLLAKPGVTAVIIGARKDEQLADNLGAADVHLTVEDIDRLDKVSAPVLIYPHWHQANLVSSRFSEADLALHAPAR
ncbi:aldo/keto reductase [Saccharopolyspora sp. K220]|uniref:aldo/keto reductase n=1 Tax=Saccharopolyspora soli TaxID=2926618 RepID=UPI001F59C75E|nr:aldo/keto reductase [Saccharopolyspora soli]MCI2423373.1 aldo/keto reductase [Saccharopolyspora soli]